MPLPARQSLSGFSEGFSVWLGQELMRHEVRGITLSSPAPRSPAHLPQLPLSQLERSQPPPRRPLLTRTGRLPQQAGRHAPSPAPPPELPGRAHYPAVCGINRRLRALTSANSGQPLSAETIPGKHVSTAADRPRWGTRNPEEREYILQKKYYSALMSISNFKEIPVCGTINLAGAVCGVTDEPLCPAWRWWRWPYARSAGLVGRKERRGGRCVTHICALWLMTERYCVTPLWSGDNGGKCYVVLN
ncbi:hypothetical protein E2C01_003726 [Portunus trituberculatus]|uniref:Uncharacterized protein n=1 Tax=Portunus trituberculatus TaxID=210409 RepID=A0A5B7CUA9_PORTR|nr:hypothetical protein [Portunus trituberculatus]